MRRLSFRILATVLPLCLWCIALSNSILYRGILECRSERLRITFTGVTKWKGTWSWYYEGTRRVVRGYSALPLKALVSADGEYIVLAEVSYLHVVTVNGKDVWSRPLTTLMDPGTVVVYGNAVVYEEGTHVRWFDFRTENGMLSETRYWPGIVARSIATGKELWSTRLPIAGAPVGTWGDFLVAVYQERPYALYDKRKRVFTIRLYRRRPAAAPSAKDLRYSVQIPRPIVNAMLRIYEYPFDVRRVTVASRGRAEFLFEERGPPWVHHKRRFRLVLDRRLRSASFSMGRSTWRRPVVQNTTGTTPRIRTGKEVHEGN